MQNKLNVRAIALYDNGVLLFNGDGYSSDTGYTVIVTVVGNQSKTDIRVFIEGQAYNVAIKAYK